MSNLDFRKDKAARATWPSLVSFFTYFKTEIQQDNTPVFAKQKRKN